MAWATAFSCEVKGHRDLVLSSWPSTAPSCATQEAASMAAVLVSEGPRWPPRPYAGFCRGDRRVGLGSSARRHGSLSVMTCGRGCKMGPWKPIFDITENANVWSKACGVMSLGVIDHRLTLFPLCGRRGSELEAIELPCRPIMTTIRRRRSSGGIGGRCSSNEGWPVSATC